jgi:ATP-dependent RNA helicase RhlE
MTFDELNLIEPILKALKEEGYTTPTPIQEQAIPPLLDGRDLLGCAQTGTGKTAAFAIPIIQLLYNSREVDRKRKLTSTLILTPTRELAIQIGESFAAYGRHTGLKHTVIFGGVSQYNQTNALKYGIDIIIATPGRLLDLMNQGFVDLNHIKLFVLDEADRMLDMGFVHDVKKVLAKLPRQKQSLFFSATMPPVITKLADSILHNPVKVEVTPVSSTAETIQQAVYFVDKGNKKLLLMDLLKNSAMKSVLVFTRTKHGADRVARDITKHGFKAAAIHGDKSQNARQHALNDFKTGKLRTLIATDIAARGIDVDNLSHVINYEMPNVPETYVHRIGRTGRAGANGVAYSFCDAEEKEYLKDIQKLIGKAIPVISDHGYPMQDFNPAPKPKQPQGRRPEGRGGNGGGGRSSHQPSRGNSSNQGGSGGNRDRKPASANRNRGPRKQS